MHIVSMGLRQLARGYTVHIVSMERECSGMWGKRSWLLLPWPVSAVGFFCPGLPQVTAETPTRQVHDMLLPVH